MQRHPSFFPNTLEAEFPACNQHASKAIIPAYFRLLQSQDKDKQDGAREELVAALNKFGDQVKGPYW